MTEYKVVELAVVTAESIEEVLNERSAEGWHFDSIQFVVRDASKRPAMAFLLFTREGAVAVENP
jgi:tRNA1(Val) A37 N6-methylase TrmN6